MKPICSKCKNHAVIFIRYNGTHLCKEHFIKYLEKRVKKEINKQGKLENNTKIGIAVSGGKDSIVALHLIKKFFLKRKNIDRIQAEVVEKISRGM